MDDIERLKAALDRQVVFRCHPCPPTRLAIGQELAAAYPVHRVGPSSTAENTFPPELRHLLAQFGGLQLFCSKYEGNNGPWRSMAFELFSADEIIRISRNCRDEHPDNEWLGRLIIIGGDPSGDLFAIDSTVDSDACQVYHLDHGYLYGEEAAPDAQIEVAPSIPSLLHRIVSGPLPWLGTWRHLDEYGEQYDVTSITSCS